MRNDSPKFIDLYDDNQFHRTSLKMGGGGGGGGGGGTTGGTVVQSTAPWAALLAGQYGVDAANQAISANDKAMKDALNAVNQHYIQASYLVQPYRTAGVQALDQLNQYLGLAAYNPGAAPNAPKAPQGTINYQTGSLDGNSDWANLFNTAITIGKKYGLDLPGTALDGKTSTGMENLKRTGGISEAQLKKAGVNSSVASLVNLPGGPDDPERTRGGLPVPGNQAHVIASVASQLYDRLNQAGVSPVSKGTDTHLGNDFPPYNSTDSYFLQKFQEFGGSPGQDGTTFLQNFNKSAQEAYDIAKVGYDRDLTEYNQNKAWYDKYSAEGPLSSSQIQERISNLPGYQAELGQGVDAIQKAGSAQGYLGSGRVLKELSQYGQNTLSKYYGDTLSRLAAIAGQGYNAATQTSQGEQQRGNTLAALYQSLGENKANALLAAGNAKAQGLTAANQRFDVLGQTQLPDSGGGGGGLGGIGSLLGSVGSLVSAFSSRELKDPVHSVNTQEILNSVNELNLDKWKYKGIDKEHIGPYAEEFKELFNVGDGQTINMIDAVGVLFASVKQLSKELRELKGAV